MSLIEVNCNKNLIYVAIYWLLEISFRLVSKLLPDFFKLVDDKIQNEYLLVTYATLGDLLAGFLVLYSYFSSKSQKAKLITKVKDNSKISVDFIYQEPTPFQDKNFLLKILIIALLEYISRSTYWIAYAVIGVDKVKSQPIQRDISYTVDIFMRYIFSFLLLKIKIYFHHKVSLIIIFIGFLFLLAADIIYFILINKIDNVISCVLFTLILLIRSFASPYEHTLIKKIFSENFIFPQKLQFIRGILDTILVILIAIIFSFAFNLQINTNFKVETIISAIAYILSSFIKEFVLLKVIEHISAQSVSFLIIAKSLGNCIYRIISVFKESSQKGEDEIAFFVLEILGIFIILFATLIYDEVFIINKWDLDYNTKNRITEREANERGDENINELQLIPTITVRNNIEDS